MEKIHYEITPPDDEQWKTSDRDIAVTAFEKGCHVVEFKEYTTYQEHTVVRLSIATEWTTTEKETER